MDKEKEIVELKRNIKLLEKELETAPQGTLRVHLFKRANGKEQTFYTICTYIDGKRSEKYVKNSDDETLRIHAKKRYYRKLLPALRKELKQKLAMQKSDLSECEKYGAYENLHPQIARLVTALYKRPEAAAREWAEQPYKRNPFPLKDGAYFETAKGDTTRSKNEYITADKLYHAGVPYRYEAPYVLLSGETVYPDFTVMHPRTNELYYLEIVGRLDDEDYRMDAMRKFRKYSIQPDFDHFIFIFDYPGAAFDPTAIDNLIKTVFS